jgi:hypothetical protein
VKETEPYANQQVEIDIMTKKQAQASTDIEQRLTWPTVMLN